MSTFSDISQILRIEQLREDNWFSWKRRITAIMREIGLDGLLDGTVPKPEPKDKDKPSEDEKKAIQEWNQKDAKARNRLDICITETVAAHLDIAGSAKEMWEILAAMYEPKGMAAVTSARRRFIKTCAEEQTDIPTHISDLRQQQARLHLMGSLIPDKEFSMHLLTSLPDSWDGFISSYFGATGTSKINLTSQELIAVIQEEDRRRKEKSGGSETAMFTKQKGGYQQQKTPLTCHNCKKPGHLKADCWSPGGGKEGQGPRRRKRNGKDRVNNAEDVEEDLPADAFVVVEDTEGEEETVLAAGESIGQWYADSAATSHITNRREIFETYTAIKTRVRGIGSTAKAIGRGSVTLQCKINGKTRLLNLKSVLHIPDAPNNLVSIGRLEDAGGWMKIKTRRLTLMNGQDETIATGNYVNRMYLLDAESVQPKEEALVASSKETVTWEELHRRLGHIGLSTIKAIVANGELSSIQVEGKPIETLHCEACIQAKITVRSFPKEANERAKERGERTHSDVWGPARVATIGKAFYYISFKDDATRYLTAEMMKTRAEVPVKVRQYLMKLETQLEKRPKKIRVDNAKEYTEGELKKWAAEVGIIIEQTAPYSPEQNGVSERVNRTLIEMVRAVLIASGLPTYLWGEALQFAVYIRNRVPTPALDGKTPYEAWRGERPELGHIRAWGTEVWVRREVKGSKLEPKATKHVFVGFEDGPKAIRYYKKDTRQVLISRNYHFGSEPTYTGVPLEGVFGDMVERNSTDPKTTPPTPAITTSHAQNVSNGMATATTQQASTTIPTAQPKPVPAPTPRDLPARAGRAPRDFNYRRMGNPDARPRKEGSQAGDGEKDPKEVPLPTDDDDLESEEAAWTEEAYQARVHDADTPEGYRQAKESEDWEGWEKAMDEEMDQHKKMGTWELLDLPQGRTAIGCRWVYNRKIGADLELERLKARLVAQGFSQIPGIDFQFTYAETLRLDSQRAILALGTTHNYDIHQMDVKTAYLNSTLTEDIYMRQPEHYDDGTGRVCKLKRAIYGLKQAAREWSFKFGREMVDLGFTRTHSDGCVYIRRRHHPHHSDYVTAFVDDLTLLAKGNGSMDRLKADLKSKFDLKDLGIPRLIIGIQIDHNPTSGTMTLSQSNYTQKILTRFSMDNSHPVTTPLDKNATFTRREDHDEPVDQRLYMQAIGSLLYLSIATRPDIAHVVHVLSQFSSDPGATHWSGIKRVLRYLRGTTDYGLTYSGDHDGRSDEFKAYTDADFGCQPDRRSTSGYAFLLAGAAISWSSKKQQLVTLSSTESEYVAATHATKHAMWLRQFLGELGFLQPATSTLRSDNQSAIALSLDSKYHARTKHIDIQYHYVREKVQDGILNLQYCPTAEMTADILTKGLDRQLFDRHRAGLGLGPV
jgi:transposase InsO family protein